MWNTTARPFPELEQRDVGNRKKEDDAARKAALVNQIEAYIRGERQQEVSALDLASMTSGARRLLTLRNGLLFATHRAYRRGAKTRTSLLPGILVLISAFSDSDTDGFCWLSEERIAKFLNTARESVSRVIDEAEEAGLIVKVAARRGFSNGYMLAMPSALADPATNIFSLLDALAPRESDVLPHGRRREVGQNVRRADDQAGIYTPDAREHTITADDNTREHTITSVANRCDHTTGTGVSVCSHDTSTKNLSEEEEDVIHPGLGDIFNFSRPGAPRESSDEVAPSPLAPPASAVDYATDVALRRASATHLGWVVDRVVPDDLVQTFAEIIAWCPPVERSNEWQPSLDLHLARKQLGNVFSQADAASHPDDRHQALRDAVYSLKGKFDDAEAAIARRESADLVRKPVPYLQKAFRDRLRKIPIERHKDQLAVQSATLKAHVDARTEVEISQRKLTAFDTTVDRKAKAQQKLADARVAKAGAPRAARSERRAYGVIDAEDGSKTFDAYAEVMEVHRTKVAGRHALAIMDSFDGATVSDTVDALHRVVDRDKPKGRGNSGFFDPLSIDKVVALAKSYLPAIVLHREYGPPSTFVDDGPAAFETEYVAVGQRWLDQLKLRLPDLTHVNVGDGVRALGLPSEVISGSKAFLSESRHSRPPLDCRCTVPS